MKRTAMILLACALNSPFAGAQSLSVQHMVRSGSVLAAEDLRILETTYANAFRRMEDLIGLEARRNLYPGRPILPTDVGPPTIVERNQIVTLVYSRGALEITVEGRSLNRGAIGEPVRAMNLSSKAMVSGIVLEPGRIEVTP